MSAADRVHWDRRYAELTAPGSERIGLPTALSDSAGLFPRAGHAVDVACGSGAAAVWLALRGLTVVGYDISPLAVGHAEALARLAGCERRCRFVIADLDEGLPPGDPADVLLCNGFRDTHLYPVFTDRLAPGGLLALGTLSVVGAEATAASRFRAARGELVEAFAGLETIRHGESGGRAWLLARAPG